MTDRPDILTDKMAPAEPFVPAPMSGLRRLAAAWRNSMAGLSDVWSTAEAFRLEAAILAISVPAAFWIADGALARAALIGAVLFVMIVEVLNSAIEAAIDRIGPERHEKSRMAKDLGSLAVLLAAILAGILWIAAAAARFWPG
jgi:diacylglycerol kinase (ATP)